MFSLNLLTFIFIFTSVVSDIDNNYGQRLYSEPVLIRGADNQTKQVGETADFSCQFLSDTHLHIIWQHQRVSRNYGNNVTTYLNPNKDERITMNEELSQHKNLTIYNVTQDDAWLVAENTLGKSYAKGYLTVLDANPGTAVLDDVTSTGKSKRITYILIVAIMTFTLAIVMVVIVMEKAIRTTNKLMSEQWTKIVSIERMLSNGHNDGTPTLRMPVVTIEKQKLIDVEKNYTYSVVPSEYVLPLDATWEISRHDVTLQKVLGEGEFGKVMKAECFGLPNSSTSETVAVKDVKRNSSTELKQRELIDFALQVANGMEFLVERGCVHRDLAARNVLVSGARVLKVADFGLARDVRDSDFYRKRLPGKLPLRWMAPESICDNFYNNKSDVWSFGVLTWEIMTLGDTPYQHVPPHYLYHYLKLGQRVEKPASCSEETYDLINHCGAFNPDGRPTFAEIKVKLQAIQLKTLD